MEQVATGSQVTQCKSSAHKLKPFDLPEQLQACPKSDWDGFLQKVIRM